MHNLGKKNFALAQRKSMNGHNACKRNADKLEMRESIDVLKNFNLHLTNEPNVQSSMVLLGRLVTHLTSFSPFHLFLSTFAYINKERKS